MCFDPLYNKPAANGSAIGLSVGSCETTKMQMTAEMVRVALWERRNPEKAAFFPRFFKCGPGEYGEGDKFIGVTVPHQRTVARAFKELSFDQLKLLLKDPHHECRLTALLILVLQYERAKDIEKKHQVSQFYLSNLDSVNNWDLVDSSAHKILGAEVVRTGEREVLGALADSGDLWRERVAVIATLALIKQKDLEPTLRLCRHFLSHSHDLIHKATGWMLREVGKVSKRELERFLSRHSKEMPRVMLRYAIEKMPPDERQHWMK